MEKWLVKTVRSRNNIPIEAPKWDIVDSLNNPQGSGFNQLTDPPIKNLITFAIRISDIEKLQTKIDFFKNTELCEALNTIEELKKINDNLEGKLNRIENFYNPNKG